MGRKSARDFEGDGDAAASKAENDGIGIRQFGLDAFGQSAARVETILKRKEYFANIRFPCKRMPKPFLILGSTVCRTNFTGSLPAFLAVGLSMVAWGTVCAQGDQQTPAAAVKVTGAVAGVQAPGAALTLPITGKISSVQIHSATNPQMDANLAPIPGTATESGFKILLPAKLDAGPYYFSFGDNPPTTIPGSIDVEPDKIQLTSVYPTTAYKQIKKIDFDLIGENFSLNPESDDVTIQGQGSIVNDVNKKRDKKNCSADQACLWVEKIGRASCRERV